MKAVKSERCDAIVTPALGAGVHVLKLMQLKDVDGRDKARP